MVEDVELTASMSVFVVWQVRREERPSFMDEVGLIAWRQSAEALAF